MADLKDLYLAEAEELINKMEESLLQLEKNPEDSALVADVFRSMHTLKGTSSMYGSTKVADFLHHLETIYDKVRSNELKLSGHLIDSTLASMDHLKNIVGDPEIRNPEDQKKNRKLSNSFRAILANDPGQTPTGSSGRSMNEKAWYVYFKPKKDVLKDGTSPILLVDELAALGQSLVIPHIDKQGMLGAYETDACYTSWELILKGDIEQSSIEEVFLFLQDDESVKIHPLSVNEVNFNLIETEIGETRLDRPVYGVQQIEQWLKSGQVVYNQLSGRSEKKNVQHGLTRPPAVSQTSEVKVSAPILKDVPVFKETKKEKPKATAPTIKKGGEAISSIRVTSEKLDDLMNQVSELVTAQAGLSLYHDEHPNPRLEVITEDIAKLTRRLRDLAFGMTLIEINSLFGRFQRTVRDLSQQLGKQVDFETEGGETELDKKIIEALSDPLLHIIRNSVDHGIESMEERKAAGKPEVGRIRLRSFYSGAKVYIEVEDDGGGINPQVIRNKAIEKGLIGKDDVLSEKETLELIFAAGFSTAKVVSEVSGRGVGMDVVRKNIMEIRGDIGIDSVLGEGTKITLGLPLTLSVIDGLLVKIKDTHFVIPLEVVERCFQVPKSEVSNDFNQLIVLNEEQVPYVDLRKEFGLLDKEDESDVNIVVVKNDTLKMGLCVEAIAGEYQAVLKPLGKYYRSQEFISGATIMGDGSIALVLDTYRILSMRSDKKKMTA